MRYNRSITKRIDWLMIGLYVVLVICGWFSICGASYNYADTDFLDLGSRTGKQAMWIFFSFGLGGILMFIEARLYEAVAPFFYVGMLGLLLLTIFVADDTKGSNSWLHFGPVSLQPAEFAKFATALMLAKVANTYPFDIKKSRDFATVLAIVFIPMLLIVAQKETGTALAFLSFFLMFYREGMSGAILFSGVALILYFILDIKFSHDVFFAGTTNAGQFIVLSLIIFISAGMMTLYTKRKGLARVVLWPYFVLVPAGCIVSSFFFRFDVNMLLWGLAFYTAVCQLWWWVTYRMKQYGLMALFTGMSMLFLFSSGYVFEHVLQDHQRTRIEVLFGLQDDPRGAGYNVNQSKIAIGSGGAFGKGFLNGTQTKLKYVPEQDTDFIFCTIGEEQGFFGASVVLLLFLVFILRLVHLSERQDTVFGRVYGYAVTGIFLFHLLINVGMVLGLTPVIGIPLPFFSYGGSSLLGFTILLFVFLRIDAERGNG